MSPLQSHQPLALSFDLRDSDFLGRGIRALEQADLEYAVFETGLGVVVFDSGRKWDRAGEGAIAALANTGVALLVLLGLLVLARNDEAVVADVNVHVFLGNARQLGMDDELLVCLVDINYGNVAATAAAAASARSYSAEVAEILAEI